MLLYRTYIIIIPLLFGVEMYVNDAKKGNIVNEGAPEILSEKGGTAWVHGHNLLGERTFG